jgi:hypothetical protein
MKKDPRLARIAEWRNKATEEELKWIDFAGGWFDYNVKRELFFVESIKDCFREALKSGDIFSSAALVILDTSVEAQTQRKRFGSTRCEQENGTVFVFSLAAPSLSRKSCNQLSDVLGSIFDLWQEGVLDKDLNHPRLKRCPVCCKWFAVSKADQRYCTSNPYPPCREVALRGKPGEESPQRLQYREQQRKKMADKRRKDTEHKEREAKARDKDKLRDLRKRPTFPTSAT